MFVMDFTKSISNIFYRQLKYCPIPPIPRDGPCGSGGQQDCFLQVIRQYPASAVPRKIKCVDIGPNKSQCTAEIVCG
ncbi:hypothetical protein CDL12_20424 [Handroanthus impetiginosus]|uniref:Uncharacterized protein n=1 Tax=Handroanthus impetiginosus TaxID=429701 RepID=A0A2G9GP76_9LAMI|nr:hypothetical protein CDL12_20424 [Handroanthus impetiginosus]